MRIKLKLISIIFLALFFGFLSPKIALADTFTLSGSVQDSSGHVISGATVSVNDVNADSTTTDVSGNYSLSVPSGAYNVQTTPPPGDRKSCAQSEYLC
jgi:hypothetical protein